MEEEIKKTELIYSVMPNSDCTSGCDLTDIKECTDGNECHPSTLHPNPIFQTTLGVEIRYCDSEVKQVHMSIYSYMTFDDLKNNILNEWLLLWKQHHPRESNYKKVDTYSIIFNNRTNLGRIQEDTCKVFNYLKNDDKISFFDYRIDVSFMVKDECKIDYFKSNSYPICTYNEKQEKCDMLSKYLSTSIPKQDSWLNHIVSYSHPNYKNQECQFGNKCQFYVRLLNNGCSLIDRCHVLLYSHSMQPRIDRIRTNGQNIVPFEINDSSDLDGNMLEIMKMQGKMKLGSKSEHELLLLLVQEIGKNGYKNSLINSKDMVFEKYNHPRHKKMGYPLNCAEIIALLLHINGDCSFDIRKYQRNNDFKKWLVFDYCLYYAITKLNEFESDYNTPIYSGLFNVIMDFPSKCDPQNVSVMFPTYQSFTLDKHVAQAFRGDSGIIFGIKCNGFNELEYCACDVSWISKFPKEKEILLRRNAQIVGCFVLSKISQKQTVVLGDHTTLFV